MLSKIFLTDNSPQLISAWKQVFSQYNNFEITLGDYFTHKADAIVSPANSFGIMDGGLDLAIRYELGFDIEESLQKAILSHHHGELPVGSAIIIQTTCSNWPLMIAAPTMRVPENVSDTLNPYLAFRAVLLAIKHHNETSKKKIKSLLCPGLGTGIGGVESKICAIQMREAYEAFLKPAKIPKYRAIYSMHKNLKRSQDGQF